MDGTGYGAAGTGYGAAGTGDGAAGTADGAAGTAVGAAAGGAEGPATAAGGAEGPATAAVRRFWQRLFHEGALAEAEQLVTPDLEWRGSLGATSSDLEGFLAYARTAAAGMPDLRVSLEEVLERDGHVAARLVFRATHHGTLLGVPATGRRVEYVGAGFFDVTDDGRLRRAWVVGDTLALHRQLVAD